jgi:hypothetical protein
LKKVIIVSAVNLTQAGPLTVLQECLKYLSDNLADKYRVIALVNKKELFDLANIEYLEFPKSKKSWLNRLFYEYYYFRKISEQYRPDLWLSLHDMTPNVCAKRLAVYCHNASAFYNLSLQEASLDVRFTLFNLFYKYLYLINIKKNDFITDKVYATLVNRAKATRTLDFKKLLSFGLIDRKGKGKATYYVVKYN